MLDADKAIQDFYDRMWGKGAKEASPNTVQLSTRYVRVLDGANCGRTIDGRLVRDEVREVADFDELQILR